MMCHTTKLLYMHMSLYKVYTLNVMRLSNDIYIEIKNWTEGDFKMTIDARKIISNLVMPLHLENV